MNIAIIHEDPYPFYPLQLKIIQHVSSVYRHTYIGPKLHGEQSDTPIYAPQGAYQSISHSLTIQRYRNDEKVKGGALRGGSSSIKASVTIPPARLPETACSTSLKGKALLVRTGKSGLVGGLGVSPSGRALFSIEWSNCSAKATFCGRSMRGVEAENEGPADVVRELLGQGEPPRNLLPKT